MIQRTPTEVELAVFKYLDILHEENKVGIRAIIKKWNFDTDTALKLIQLWNKNHGKDYKLIETL